MMLFLSISCKKNESIDEDEEYTDQVGDVVHYISPVTLSIVDEEYRVYYMSGYVYLDPSQKVRLDDGTASTISQLKNGTKLWINHNGNVIESGTTHFEKIYSIKLR